jgi:glycosyltransferase involved in cell wall biosynthesis
VRILWATNFAAPYRLPVWEHIGAKHELRVLLLEDDAKVRDGSLNRGSDWASDVGSYSFAMTVRRTWGFTRGEARHYVLPPTGQRSALHGVDAVLLGGWESPAYWQLLLQAKARGVRTVGFYESTRLTQAHVADAIGAVRSRYFRTLDAVVVPGAAARDAVLDMGVSPNCVFLGFNAVDVRGINDGARVARGLDGFELSEGHRYLCIAQLVGRKNLASLIEAFASIRNQGDSLRLVGTGPLSSSLRSLADGIPVHFDGHVPYSELPALLARHQTLALASTEEVWGLVVNEALAAGLHVVVSDQCGVVESVRGMQGTYVTPPDRDSIAGALNRSRQDWRGPIETPEILRYSPEEFAQVFERALQSR